MNSISRQGNKPSDSVRGIPFEQEGRFRIARWAPIPLRLIVGYGFMRMVSQNCPGGPKRSPTFFTPWACPLHTSWAWVTILSEVFGGLAIILGAFVSSEISERRLKSVPRIRKS